MSSRVKNITIYLIAIMCALAILGHGFLDTSLRELSFDSHEFIDAPAFSTLDDIKTIHVTEPSRSIAVTKTIKGGAETKSQGTKTSGLLLELIILFVTVYFINRICHFYQRLYISTKYYLIDYIHAKDGLKSFLITSLVSM